MADLRERLEQKSKSLLPEPGGFERLVLRRRAREVRRRVVAGAVAVIVALVGTAAIFTAFHNATQKLPTIAPDNIHSLHQAWIGHVEGDPSVPVIADGMVYVSADRLYAFSLACVAGPDPCNPTWTGDIGGASSETPVVADGVVLTVSDAGMFAFDASCAGPTCSPLWRAPSPSHEASEDYVAAYSVPAVSNGFLYAAGGDGLYVFPIRCRDDRGVCRPAWVGIGYGSAQTPAVGDRLVYVGSHLGLEGYPLTCEQRRCDRSWFLDASHPLGTGGTKASQFDVTYSPTVSSAEQDLYVNNGRFSADPRDGSLRQRWVARLDATSERDLRAGTVGHATVADDVVYLTASRVYAFPVGCVPGGNGCLATWKGPRQFDQMLSAYRTWSDAVVADGLVFASTDRPYAFAEGCASGGQVCAPLWVGPEGFASKPAVSDTAVVVTYADGRVVAFEPTAP
jgi:hypothetical protein